MMAVRALAGVMIRLAVAFLTISVPAMIEPIWHPGIGAMTPGALPGIMARRGLVGVARDAA